MDNSRLKELATARLQKNKQQIAKCLCLVSHDFFEKELYTECLEFATEAYLIRKYLSADQMYGLFFNLVHSHIESGFIEEAREIATHYLFYCQNTCGKVGIRYAESCGTMATLFLYDRNLDDAMTCYEMAKKAMENNAAAFSELLTRFIMNLWGQGFYSMAVTQFKRAVLSHELTKSQSLSLHWYFAERFKGMKQCFRACVHLTPILKSLSESDPLWAKCKEQFTLCWRASRNLKLADSLVDTDLRMCSLEDCFEIHENIPRCLSCKLYYLCGNHSQEIYKHALTCHKYPDELPRMDLSNYCRSCFKTGKLQVCAGCKRVRYCNAKCSKKDWKRHKLFCK